MGLLLWLKTSREAHLPFKLRAHVQVKLRFNGSLGVESTFYGGWCDAQLSATLPKLCPGYFHTTPAPPPLVHFAKISLPDPPRHQLPNLSDLCDGDGDVPKTTCLLHLFFSNPFCRPRLVEPVLLRSHYLPCRRSNTTTRALHLKEEVTPNTLNR